MPDISHSVLILDAIASAGKEGLVWSEIKENLKLQVPRGSVSYLLARLAADGYLSTSEARGRTVYHRTKKPHEDTRKNLPLPDLSREQWAAFIESLSPSQQRVFHLLVKPATRPTLDEAGDQAGCSREAMRQGEAKVRALLETFVKKAPKK